MVQVVAVETQGPATALEQIGDQIVTCIRDREFERLADHFCLRVVSRLLIPSGLATPLDSSTLIARLSEWFRLADLYHMEGSYITVVGDTLHVGYRIRLREEGVWYVVEQQTYSRFEEGSIVHFDLMCSGFRPIEGEQKGGIS